jgi:hypothetical protein
MNNKLQFAFGGVVILPIFFAILLKNNEELLVTVKKDKAFKTINIEQNTSSIFDTLVFNNNMEGEYLAKKFKTSLTKMTFYRNFISPQKKNRINIITQKHTKAEVKYLGEIKDLNRKDSYHVITNFLIVGIGEMDSPRGFSEIAFINRKKDKIIIYRMSLPDELPKKIENNILYFNHENTKIGISISGGLPPELCVPIIGCN